MIPLTKLTAMLDDLAVKMKAAVPGPWVATDYPNDGCCWDAHVETVKRDDGKQFAEQQVADTASRSEADAIVAAMNAAPIMESVARAVVERPWWLRDVPDALGNRGKECALCGAWSLTDLACGASHGWIGDESGGTHRVCDLQRIDATLDRAEAEAKS